MSRVFHRGRDNGKKRSYYYFNLLCADGKRRQRKAFTDKGKSEQYAAKMQHEEDLRRLGLIDRDQEQKRQRKFTPLSEYLAAFKMSLAANTPKHVKLTISRVRRVVEGCAFATVADINAEAVKTFMREWAVKKISVLAPTIITSKQIRNSVLGWLRRRGEKPIHWQA